MGFRGESTGDNSIAGSTDVALSSPFAGEVLSYNSTINKWHNSTTNTVINVRDYGAIGNGETDDSPAIQAAIDAAAVRGHEVFLPAGAWRLDTTVSLPSSVCLRGAGRNSIIKRTHSRPYHPYWRRNT